ncbi:chromosome segregation protein SMC [soil metagenome]
MKLRSLRLHGFKSFADRTTLDFRDGVTAIIGSNGCGKSNIADSIRWVLGEQRASAMRGAKMEEVIFQGTARRRAVNMAEVTLIFDNERGRVPIPQSEIEVARKVFREGGSEYSLNRNACRLRDVTGLLRDTGLGSNAYAIIESGIIETLLSDRAEERRFLFEEAAGIGRYKDSRHAASRRLEAAEADLSRLRDLLAEVEAKVRTLARQKGRAERYGELQARRLDLEVAIISTEVDGLRAELGVCVLRRGELHERVRTAEIERSLAETKSEERRAELAQLSGERAVIAEGLDRIRNQLVAREREVLLAEERRSHVELRIAQLDRERSELHQRQRTLTRDLEISMGQREEQTTALAALRDRLEQLRGENQSIRAALQTERTSADDAATLARDLSRQIATAEGERVAAERRRRDAEERLSTLGDTEATLSTQLSDLSEQTELWSVRSEEVQTLLEAATERRDSLREQIPVMRERELFARDAMRAAEDAVSRLSARVQAREALEQSYEGFSPAVPALMSARDRLPGVLGPLADFVEEVLEPAKAAAIDTFLGPLLQALIVEDLDAARAVREWYRSEWKKGGPLSLLPLCWSERGGASRRTPAELIDQLLGDLQISDQDPLAEDFTGGTRIGPGGEMFDSRGVIHLTQHPAEEGILARREELARMRGELEAAAVERSEGALELQMTRVSLATAEQQLFAAEESRRQLESEFRRVELHGAAHQHQRGRLQKDREMLSETVTSLRSTISGALMQMSELEARLAELSAAVEQAGERDAAARGRLTELAEIWEVARDREGELRVDVARAESDLRETERRLSSAQNGSSSVAVRLNTLEAEANDLRSALEELSEVRERAGGEIQELFLSRDDHAVRLADVEGGMVELDTSLARLEERVRSSRNQESEGSAEVHRLDLAIADLESRIERARERLEVEWGRPWDALISSATPIAEGDIDKWRRTLRETTTQLAGIGPVNMLALEEHAEEERRFTFLQEQHDDLAGARDDLLNAIRQINRTARDVFMETFSAVRENFQRVFQSLFPGGECDLWLAAPDDPLESPVEIQASPKGKRTQRIHLLSGGERTLTALALLFALYLVKPSPFCMLDEVDAPLDESNVARFIQLLQDFKAETQFIVITHNPRTMEAADWVYGVTMEEPGISTIVGVEMLSTWSGAPPQPVNT